MHAALADQVVVRECGSADDFDAMAAVREACRAVDGLDDAYTGQQVREVFATYPAARPRSARRW